jgi:hypothetical protein
MDGAPEGLRYQADLVRKPIKPAEMRALLSFLLS